MFTVFMFVVCICLGAVAASLAYALYSDLKQEREETAAHPHGLQGWEHNGPDFNPPQSAQKEE